MQGKQAKGVRSYVVLRGRKEGRMSSNRCAERERREERRVVD